MSLVKIYLHFQKKNQKEFHCWTYQSQDQAKETFLTHGFAELYKISNIHFEQINFWSHIKIMLLETTILFLMADTKILQVKD